jgi:gluconolactonase
MWNRQGCWRWPRTGLLRDDRKRPGNPDSLKVDQEGNVYCTGPGGIWILDSAGKHLGTIPTEETTTTMAWGDDDWSTLYFTTCHTLARLRLKISGVPVPRGTL